MFFLGGMQAIAHGAMPYLGTAAEQYGPGAQYLSYLYMQHIGGFLGGRVRCVAGGVRMAGLLDPVRGADPRARVRPRPGRGAADRAGLPGAATIGFVPDQSYTGFFGWASPPPYAGAITLILLLPAAIRRCPRWNGLLSYANPGLS
jgi:hypothetical protein